MPINHSNVTELLQRLSTHFDGENNSDVRHWHEVIQKQFTLDQEKTRQVVFIGGAGVGKSSALAVTANLLLEGERPRDKSSLRKQSILPTGAGRTTLCEVAIRTHQANENVNEFGLLIDSTPLVEMKEITRLWVEDEWSKRQPTSKKSLDGEVQSNSQEVSRALRSMAGYAEYRESSGARQTINPLDSVVPTYKSIEELEQHLGQCIQLDTRTQTQWWFPPQSAHTELKSMLEQVNSGTCTTATLPRRIEVVIPNFMVELTDGAQRVEFVDSRGLDAGVRLSAREDLQLFVENPSIIYVLCTPFKDAPGDAIREFLKEVKGDARWVDALQRMIIVLLDQGDADQVNGSDGDRAFGLSIKQDECVTDLRQAGIFASDESVRMVALDTLQDDPQELMSKIQEALLSLNSSIEEKLINLMNSANRFLQSLQEEARVELLPQVTERIHRVLKDNFPKGYPMDDPMLGALNAIQRTTYAAVIYASCRRKGAFRNLNVYKAIESHAAKAATAWITPPIRQVTKSLEKLANDVNFRAVQEDIRLRILRFEESKLAFVQKYSKSVSDEITPLLQKDKQLWSDCCSNWGMSNGFKNQVQEILKQWSDRQVFNAHLELKSKTSDIPFWSVLEAAQSAPRFRLHIKNLRALRHAVFAPESVSLLVGANGAGKSTLLHSLKLLRLAYERGLTEAIRLVLGGVYDLKNWFASSDEYIELGMQIGDAEWLLKLSLQNSGIDLHCQENLTYQGKVIFVRDALSGVQYGGEIVPVKSEYTALRGLMDRGEIHPAIQQISDLLARISVFEEPDLFNLRQQGSLASDDVQLHSRGQNVLSLLRKWQQDSQLQNRFEFVMQGLQAAFPSVKQMDFVGAGNWLTARTYREGVEQPAPLANEANGLLQMLVLLTNVAQSNPGGVVAIDEPENGLHPYAMRMFLRSCQQWALKYRVTFVLATHSLVLLDEFTDTPEAVFVMKTLEGADDNAIPNPLDHLCNRDWLQGFKLGDLYEQGEIGSNDDGL